MNKSISVLAVGHASSALLAISFTLCVAFDLLFPDYAMYRSWQALVPGFAWISWKSFFIGLIVTYGYGWYFALIWVPVYNLVVGRKSNEQDCCGHDHHHGAHAH